MKLGMLLPVHPHIRLLRSERYFSFVENIFLTKRIVIYNNRSSNHTGAQATLITFSLREFRE